MATSYNGWPASRYPSAIGINANWAPLGHRFPAGIKGGDVETVFTHLVHQLHNRVEPIQWYAPGDEWGYNYRVNVNNPSSLSCHASGTAIDYNATRHPNGRRGTFTSAQVRAIREIQGELGGVIKWGGDFGGTPDEMHFEINASAAKVAEVARRLRAGGPPPPPTAPLPPPLPPPPPPTQEEIDMMVRDAIELVEHAFATFPNNKRQPTGDAIAFYASRIAEAEKRGEHALAVNVYADLVRALDSEP